MTAARLYAVTIAAYVVALVVAAVAGAMTARQAIRQTFGPYADEAIRVATCESELKPWARNGQYLGLFQVSEHWRRTVPGFGSSALAQARHAYRVFRLTGSTWAHWTCKP